jgi:hypothetical protein
MTFDNTTKDVCHPNMSCVLQFISKSIWFQNMEICPATVEDLLLFVNIFDKMNIIDMTKIENPHMLCSKKLNLLYLLLRYNNYKFNKYMQGVLENIFLPLVTDIAKECEKVLDESFIDELLQDFDVQLSEIFVENYPKLNKKNIKKSVLSFIDDKLKIIYMSRNDEILKMIDESIDRYITFTNKTIDDDYNLVNNIYNLNLITSNSGMMNMFKVLECHEEINEFTSPSCFELDIYYASVRTNTSEKLHQQAQKSNNQKKLRISNHSS